MSPLVTTWWRLLAVPGRPKLNVHLSVDTEAKAVLKAIEEAAEANGIVLERVVPGEPTEE